MGYGTSSSPADYGTYNARNLVNNGVNSSNSNGRNGGPIRGDDRHPQNMSFDSTTVTLPEHDVHTPLIGASHRTVEFHSNHGRSLSLPLLYDDLFQTSKLSFYSLHRFISVAHELSRLIFGFKRDGFLETVGPAGTNTMNSLYVLAP